MTPPRSKKSRDEATSPARGHATMNSVSTRIILCVFVSTLLTAFIVSWLSVGAIHNDVRARVAHHSDLLLREHGGAVEHLHANASTELARAAAIGTAWHGELTRTLAATTGSSEWSWSADDVPARDRSASYPPLPAPPAELAGHFDRLTMRRSPSTSRSEPDCLVTAVDLVTSDPKLVAGLEGCLSREALYGAIQPPVSELRGLRILVADHEGRIVAAAGVRAESRIGQTLPMVSLLYPPNGQLANYTDVNGNRLVGSLSPLARTGSFVIAEAEYTRAFAPAIAITNQIFIVDVCIILLFSVLAYKIALAIMQPIEALSRGAQRIAEGHTDYEIPMPANDDDELGLLTRSFNAMMRKLRSNQLEIENDRIRLAEKNEELQRANEILAQLSITDGLTKLHNHRYFQDHLTREIKRVSRTKAPLALILLDIDDFKLLNDTHGHAAGDEVLVSLAAIMNDSARESDLIARYGGEEFVILMPNTDLAGAVHLAEKIRMTVESTRLIIGDNMKPIDITISLGVALFGGDRREFFAEADKALYQAKAAGKNCVIIAGSDATEVV